MGWGVGITPSALDQLRALAHIEETLREAVIQFQRSTAQAGDGIAQLLACPG